MVVINCEMPLLWMADTGREAPSPSLEYTSRPKLRLTLSTLFTTTNTRCGFLARANGRDVSAGSKKKNKKNKKKNR
jgi:hypothetical protein